MKNYFRIFIVIMFSILYICFCHLITYAAIPHLINYQGKLTDKTGKPVNDTAQSITFRIYDAESGGNLLWQETQSVIIQRGIFNVLLGSVTNLDIAFDKPYWLEIKIQDEVMTPRQRIASVGYAIRAETIDKIEDSIKNSIVKDNNKIQLSGDSASPGNNKLYGTNEAGIKGWYDNQSHGRQLFTSTGTFTVPPNVTMIYLTGSAGGGGGGAGISCTNTKSNGGGGGGGEACISKMIQVIPKQTYVVDIGNGGKGGIITSGFAQSGQKGETTTFGSLLTLSGGLGGGPPLDCGQGYPTYGGGGTAGGDGGSNGQSGNIASGGFGGGTIFGSLSTNIGCKYGSGGAGATGTQHGYDGGQGFLLIEW